VRLVADGLHSIGQLHLKLWSEINRYLGGPAPPRRGGN
jgi:hypothetical protein